MLSKIIPKQFSKLLTYRSLATTLPQREQMQYDVVIIGGGVAGLSASIRLKQKNPDLNVCLIEKGAEIGSHILSGNLFDPVALDELLPNWRADSNAFPATPFNAEKIYYLLGPKLSFPIPVPKLFHSKNCYVISLGQLCKYLAGVAESQGVEIYTGFSGREVLYDEKLNKVVGVAISDVGLDKNNKQKSTFQRGIELISNKAILMAEGTRGSLSEEVISRYNLRDGKVMQTYALGIKELWEINPALSKPGLCIHTMGYPYKRFHKGAHGGGFLYHQKDNLVHLGFAIGTDYKNPSMKLYDEFQKWKLHPKIKKYLTGGTCIGYGARCINEGGFQSIPKLTFNGGALLGASAGFMNVPRLKGAHYAMKSGILAADSITEYNNNKESFPLEMTEYINKVQNSYIHKDLYKVRNVQPALKWKPHLFGSLTPFGLGYSALTGFILKGREKWTFKRKNICDHEKTLPKSKCSIIKYPKYDNKITFDLLSNLAKASVLHEEDQPCHLTYRHENSHQVPSNVSYPIYGGIEENFCPAKVYEYIDDPNAPNGKRMQINASNCLHCKCCDIKATENCIKWVTPEGSGGPAYERM